MQAEILKVDTEQWSPWRHRQERWEPVPQETESRELVNSLRETENTLLGITNIYRTEESSLVSQVRNPHLHHDIYMMQNIIPGKEMGLTADKNGKLLTYILGFTRSHQNV